MPDQLLSSGAGTAGVTAQNISCLLHSGFQNIHIQMSHALFTHTYIYNSIIQLNYINITKH